MFQTKASQIFSRNKVAESKSKRNVLQMIRDVYEDMAVAHTELAEAMREIATARASADDDEEEDYDLHSVDADDDARYEAFLEELYLPSRVQPSLTFQ